MDAEKARSLSAACADREALLTFGIGPVVAGRGFTKEQGVIAADWMVASAVAMTG